MIEASGHFSESLFIGCRAGLKERMGDMRKERVFAGKKCACFVKGKRILAI